MKKATARVNPAMPAPTMSISSGADGKEMQAIINVQTKCWIFRMSENVYGCGDVV
jgi:hypothetical protein